jgi:K+-sensing histidine kinase KdpD
LSTIKHETIYYPNRIKQILDRLHGGLSEEEERQQVETISELIGYYKDVFTILSSCASRQLEEVTFRRSEVKASDLAEGATKYFRRVIKKSSSRLELNVKADPLMMTGDAVLLRYLLESLINEAMTYAGDGVLELQIYKEGAFVRFDFIDRRRNYSQEELNQLFYPHLSRMQHAQEGVLAGTEYLVCKQIIRDHDEFAGRRGCRMNACVAEGGGFMVWFTIPAR